MNKTRLAAIALISVAVSWGAAFVLMEPAIERQPIFNFLADRFTIAVAVMILARPSVLQQFNKKLGPITSLPLLAIHLKTVGGLIKSL